jgi:hypothetical protein
MAAAAVDVIIRRAIAPAFRGARNLVWVMFAPFLETLCPLPAVLWARKAAAVFVGFVLGSCVNMALILSGMKLIPLPAGIDAGNMESLAAGAHLLRPQHFLFPFLAHAFGTLIGACTTYLAASPPPPSWPGQPDHARNQHPYRSSLASWAGVLFLLGGVLASTMIPAPAWFLVLDLAAAYLPMAWLGTALGRRIIRTYGHPDAVQFR